MKRFILVMTLFAGIIGGGLAIADKKVSMEGIKCIVAGTPAKEDHAVGYKDAKVYFCCDKCPKKFEADKSKFTAKANHQLVATKQFEQGVCPITGSKLDDSTSIEIAGAKVAFCCTKCKGKAEGMKGDEQLDLVFGEKAFETAKFAKVKPVK